MIAGLLKKMASPFGADAGGAAATDADPAADPRLRYCAVIDMRGDDFEAHRQQITQQVMDAAKSIGFFQVINHGIPQSEVDAAFALSEAYFGLPYETKAAGSIKNKYGIMPFGHECPARETGNPKADLKESLLASFRPDVAEIWPPEAECPGLRAGMERFMLACSHVNTRLLECCEDGLGLARGTLTSMHAPNLADCLNVTRPMYYPALTEKTSRARCSAHTDFCSLTCLFQRPGQPGLEVFIPETRSWLPIPPEDGAITINCGEMLAYQSDGLLKSNLHRVKTPQPGEEGSNLRARYSIAFFANGSHSAVVKGEVSGSNPPMSTSEFYDHKKVNQAGHPAYFQRIKRQASESAAVGSATAAAAAVMAAAVMAANGEELEDDAA